MKFSERSSIEFIPAVIRASLKRHGLRQSSCQNFLIGSRGACRVWSRLSGSKRQRVEHNARKTI